MATARVPRAFVGNDELDVSEFHAALAEILRFAHRAFKADDGLCRPRDDVRVHTRGTAEERESPRTSAWACTRCLRGNDRPEGLRTHKHNPVRRLEFSRIYHVPSKKASRTASMPLTWITSERTAWGMIPNGWYFTECSPTGRSGCYRRRTHSPSD